MGPNLPLLRCRRTDTLQRALEQLAAAGDKFDRLLCVDDAGRCTGVITISDILSHFCSSAPVPWVTEGFEELRVRLVSGGGRGEGGGGGGGGGGGEGDGMGGPSRQDSSVGLALER